MEVSSDSQAYCLSYFTCRKFGTSECQFKNDGKSYEGCTAFQYKYYQPEMDKVSVSLTRKEFLTLPLETRCRILREQIMEVGDE